MKSAGSASRTGGKPNSELAPGRMKDQFLHEESWMENARQEIEMKMSSLHASAQEQVSYNWSTIPLHSHSFFELLYCQSGSIQYLLGTERYRIHQGDIVVIPPGISHRPIFPERMEQPYRRYVIWVNAGFVQRILEKYGEGSLITRHMVMCTAGTRWEYIGEYFRRSCSETAEKALGWQLCVYSEAIHVIVHILRAFEDLQSLTPVPEQRGLLDHALDYVETHLADKITLADAAHQLLVSESTIRQLFHRKMNVSFYRYVIQRRLIASKGLIIDGIPLETVSERVGFADYSTFYRAFKREYGLSPIQYRKLQNITIDDASCMEDLPISYP